MSKIKNETAQQKAVIQIESLKKSFGIDDVLKGINLNLYDQENLVVLGKSGSGKSVLIKCIVGLLTPDSGTINVFGQDATLLNRNELAEIRKKIGFLFQSGALYDSMSVRQNLEFPLKRIRKELNAKDREDKIMEVLTNVGLEDAVDKMPSQLSGGMRKRIGLARTLIVDPMIMLYDEPTTGLDPTTSDEISLLIMDVQNKYKTSSIIITHDIACARTVANRMVMLKDGEIYKEGLPQDFENSDDSEIKSFFK
jgi:phospholipid/cholesterol/gamma-HCH transport system ATP-binding protein